MDKDRRIAYYEEGRRPEKFSGLINCCYTCRARSQKLFGLSIVGDGDWPYSECKSFAQHIETKYSEVKSVYYIKPSDEDDGVLRHVVLHAPQSDAKKERWRLHKQEKKL